MSWTGVARAAAPGALGRAAARRRRRRSGCQVEQRGRQPRQRQEAVRRRGPAAPATSLARAGTKGTAGPNLDQAFQRSLVDGFAPQHDPGRRPPADPQSEQAPAGRPEDRQGRDVDAGRARDRRGRLRRRGLRGRGRRQAGQGHRAAGDGRRRRRRRAPPRRKNGALAIPADPTGQLFYEFEDATAPAGQLTIESKNDVGSRPQHRARGRRRRREGRGRQGRRRPRRSTSTSSPAPTRSTAPCPATARPAWRASSPSSSGGGAGSLALLGARVVLGGAPEQPAQRRRP